MTTVYVDHNATSPPRPEVLEAALPYLTTWWANPASPHALAQRPAAAAEVAREALARAVGALPRGVIFTSGATEANHLALLGAVTPRPGVAVSAVEHLSVALAFPDARVVPVHGHGGVDLDALGAVAAEVGLVSVQAASNETGVLQDLAAVYQVVRRAGALLHVDAAQVVGRWPCPPHWDLLTVSGHKPGGFKGAGALVLRPGVEVRPLQRGGHQERGRRAGTVDVPAVVSLGAVAGLRWPEALGGWRDHLAEVVARAGGTVTASEVPRLPNTLHLRVPGVEGADVVLALDLAGVCAATGAACASGAAGRSATLAAMGLPATEGVRLSLGWSTTEDEVDHVATALSRVIAGLSGGAPGSV